MSNHLNDDDKLNALQQAQPPAPSEAARRRALDAAMLAFDLPEAGLRPMSGRFATVFGNVGPVAFVLATLTAYLRAHDAYDIELEFALPKIAINLAVDSDQILGLAKLRAAREAHLTGR